ncbi:cytochrome P450 [Jackrogersella minutella]|nr:cytochrome P450 [Jackrogersella minutella]
MVRSRLALDTHAKPDFFSFVAHALPSEASKTRDSVVWKETMVFLVAGGDTAATAMTVAFFYLSRNPAYYARLAEEIRDIKSAGCLLVATTRRQAESAERSRRPMLEAFASFSIGPRNCVGKPLAYLETSTVLAKKLWYFDFEIASGPLGSVGEGSDRGRPGEFCTQDSFNSSHDGPYLVFHPQKSVSWEEDLVMSA